MDEAWTMRCRAVDCIEVASMTSSLGRYLCAALSVVLGCALLILAFCSSRFAVRDWDFVVRSPWMEPWAQTWFWRGDHARFQDLDTARAVDAYWRGVGRNPLLLGGWFALARLERQLDQGPRSDALHDFLLTHAPVSTPWRWNQLLLAADRKDEARFAQAFNFVLNRQPGYRQEAVEMALGFWGEWSTILGHADCENRWTVLAECMARQAVDACIELYPLLERDCDAILSPARHAEFIDFLLGNKRWTEAVSAGRSAGFFRDGLVTNGHFDAPVSGKAFDWRQGRAAGVEARCEDRAGVGGGHAMHFHFLGTANLRLGHFWQYLPLLPGTTCELRFVWKARQLGTDQGMYAEVRGVDCDGMTVRSGAITGNRDWSEESLVFDVPDQCRMARITFRRDESLKFDSKIRGDVWIDAVELVEKRRSR